MFKEDHLSFRQRKYMKVKNIIGRALGGIGLVVLSPVYLAIIVAIKKEDGITAPVFFSQKRVGIHKEYFNLYKFRSMRTDTPHDKPTHLLENPDQYITKVGHFLRKSSLDELPQLWNIARGDMAVIGPRPALWNQDDLIAEQKIRITYKGNAQYRPSAQTESTVTVNKAKVKVKVKSTSIYAGATLPEDFVTMNPADKFDVYTVYGGLTSNANLSLYLDLPDKYTNSAVLKLLDPIVEKLYGKTFTQMMNDGMTVGELRQLLSTQELLDLLEKLHIDTGTFGQILTIINKMPSVADSVRVSFGTPNHAGLYTVTAVTDSKNYETGVGIGTLLVKMRSKGVKLNWNERFVNGKITAEKAKNFDFKATLSADGAVTIAQDNVHYLYSGFTSKWKIYSSTTTPPTEPGSYVMTVVTLGGDYQAAPIKRGFKITK